MHKNSRILNYSIIQYATVFMHALFAFKKIFLSFSFGVLGLRAHLALY